MDIVIVINITNHPYNFPRMNLNKSCTRNIDSLFLILSRKQNGKNLWYYLSLILASKKEKKKTEGECN